MQYTTQMSFRKGETDIMAQEFSATQLEKLLEYASARLHTTPEALKAAFQQNGLYGLSQTAGAEGDLPPEIAAKAQALLQDKEKAAALLDSPEVQQLLRQLGGNP